MRFLYNLKKQNGFTIWEILVSTAVVVILSTFVLANFRTARSSGDREAVLREIINGAQTVRTMSLGGQLLANNSLPSGGYGIRLSTVTPHQFELFALVDATPENIPNGLTTFNDVEIISLCVSSVSAPSEQPCGNDWQSAGNTLEVVFTPAGPAAVITPTGQTPLHVGGLIRHEKSNQQAYFYITLQSGLVTGGLL